jgi:hypothetical protein
MECLQAFFTTKINESKPSLNIVKNKITELVKFHLIMYNSNGPPKGFNVTSDQASYDLVSKDVIVCSSLGTISPDKTTVSFNLGLDNINQIYKAELVSATVVFDSSINQFVKNQTLILSIPQLNQNTFRVAGNATKNNITQSSIFCQIPDNCTPITPGGLTPNNILSLYIGARMFDTVQYYNPPINKINTIDVLWFAPNSTSVLVDSGTSGNISSFYFTLRIYYFQKRNNTSTFSTSVFNYAGTGTLDSIFQPSQQ